MLAHLYFSRQSSSELLSLLNDLDRLLGSDSHYLLGTWIKAARDNGMTDQEKDMYEFNARNQVTLWGPRGEVCIGMVSSFLLSEVFILRFKLYACIKKLIRRASH